MLVKISETWFISQWTRKRNVLINPWSCNNTMKYFYLLLFSIGLTSCSLAKFGAQEITLLQRETNKTYSAQWPANDLPIKLELNGKVFMGKPVRVDESNLFGFKSKYGTMKSAAVIDGLLLTHYKAILKSEDNLGVRCDLTLSYNGGGSGICLDETSHIYDLLIIKQVLTN
jgi:hypothetical protein